MANRYFLNIGVNWGDTANWSDTSGGTGGFSVPTNADDVFFDANSGNCTVNVASVAKSVNFTGYTNTITMTSTLTVSGSVTLVAAMTIAGASGLTINATGTFTSNGKTWPNALTFSGTITITLADNLTIGGLLTVSALGSVTINGAFSVNCAGGITLNDILSGNSTLNITGGTWSGTNSLRINTNINGNVTISGNVRYDTGTLTYLGGSVTTTGSTLAIRLSATLNTSGINWNNLQIVFTVSNITVTLLSNLDISGLLTISTAIATVNGAFNINCSGGITLGESLAGSSTLNLLGGTWSTTSANGIVRINTNINGNITISGNVYYNTGTLTYTSGTVTTTGSTLQITNSATLNISGINLNNLHIGYTITLLSDLNVYGQFVTSFSSVTLNGTFNINCYNGMNISSAIIKGTGNQVLNLYGGTWSAGNSNAIIVSIPLNLNGNITVSGIVYYRNATITYISGTITTTGSTLDIGQGLANTTPLDTSGMVWNNVTMNGGSATLLSNLNINGLISIPANSFSVNGAFNINCNGGLNITNLLSGSATLNLTGGTWVAPVSAGVLRLNTNINGNITISGNVYYNTGTFTYLSGKVICLIGSIFNISTGTFINCDKINFRTISVTATATITMNRFFSGSVLVPTRIQSTGANYTITFQDGFEKITKFTKISNCTIANRGQLLCITDKSNKGGNVGVRYINQMPNRVPLNSPSTVSPLGYAVGQVADPNTILI